MSTENKFIKNDNHINEYGFKSTMAQIFATMAQSFLLIGLGMEIAMPTLVIQDLSNNPNSEFSLGLTEISWYGSILYIFHPPGSFVSGLLQEKFGRKRCMIFANIPSILGWILLYFTRSTISLYMSTILMGLSIGFSEAPMLSYIGEITEPRLRGSMSSVASASVMFGGSITYILGWLYQWKTVALLSTICPITCMCLVTFIPESPVWLIAKGKNEKAVEAMCWLRGWVEPETVKPEFLELIRYNEVSGTQGGKVDNDDNGFFSKLGQFKDPSVYRPLRFVMIFFFISYIICLSPCRPFFNNIMDNVGILHDNQSLLLVIFAVLQNIGCVAVILLVHHFGKRFLGLISFLINTILTLLFGVYIIALKNNYINSNPWIPVTILCAISFFGAFIVSLPWILVGEIFPNKSRGIASGSCAGLSYILMFVLTKSYLYVEIILTLQYTMITFGTVGIFGLVYLYFYLPETENKTLLEVEEFFA